MEPNITKSFIYFTCETSELIKLLLWNCHFLTVHFNAYTGLGREIYWHTSPPKIFFHQLPLSLGLKTWTVVRIQLIFPYTLPREVFSLQTLTPCWGLKEMPVIYFRENASELQYFSSFGSFCLFCCVRSSWLLFCRDVHLWNFVLSPTEVQQM